MLFSVVVTVLSVAAYLPTVAQDIPGTEGLPMMDDDVQQYVERETKKLSNRMDVLEKKADAAGDKVGAAKHRNSKRKVLSLKKRLKKATFTKPDFDKFRGSVQTFNALYEFLTSDNPDEMRMAIFSFLSSIGDLIPGPIGALIGTLFSIVSGIYGAKTPTLTDKIRLIVEEQMQLSEFRDVKKDMAGQMKALVDLQLSMNQRQWELDQLNIACVKKLKNENTSISNEDAIVECYDKTNLTVTKLYEFKDEVGNTFPRPAMEILGRIESSVAENSKSLTSVKHLDRTFKTLLLYIELRSVILMKMQDLSTFFKKYLPGFSKADVYQLKIKHEKKYFKKWLEQKFGNTSSMSRGIFALYLIHKDAKDPSLRALVEMLASRIRPHVLKPRTGLRYKAYPNSKDHEDSLMWIDPKESGNWLQYGGGYHCDFVRNGIGTKKECYHDGSNITLSYVNQSAPYLGVRMADTNKAYVYIGLRSGGYLSSGKSLKDAASFMFYPVLRGGTQEKKFKDAKQAWMISTTVAGRFAIVKDSGSYLYAYTSKYFTPNPWQFVYLQLGEN